MELLQSISGSLCDMSRNDYMVSFTFLLKFVWDEETTHLTQWKEGRGLMAEG